MTISSTLRRIPDAPPVWLLTISWCFFAWATLTVHLPWTFGTSFSILEYIEQAVRVPGPGGASPAAAGPSLVTTTNPATACSGNSSAAVVTLDMTGANAIVAAVSSVSGVSISSTNNPSGWTRTVTQGSAPGIEIWVKQNPTVSSSEAVTASGSFVGLCVMAFSGMATSGLDEAITNGAACFGGATSCQPGSVTPGAGNQLIIVGQADTATLTGTTANGGFLSPVMEQNIAGGVSYSIRMTYHIQSGSAANNPTLSYSAGVGGGGLAISALQGQ